MIGNKSNFNCYIVIPIRMTGSLGQLPLNAFIYSEVSKILFTIGLIFLLTLH